jgi:2-isopropylmalate synthase
VKIIKNGSETIQDSAMGDGMVDAAFGAIMRATGVDAKLASFNIAAVTEGTDALGDVTVQIELEGERFTGRGISTDIVEASARAFLNALNRSARRGARSRAAEPTP